MKWVARVKKANLLNMLLVPHFSQTIITTMCIRRLLTLVDEGCLLLGEPIPTIDTLIHQIPMLPYQGVDPEEDFGGEKREGTHRSNEKRVQISEEVAWILHPLHF